MKEHVNEVTTAHPYLHMNIVEIGTAGGITLRNLFNWVKEVNSKIKVHAHGVDLPNGWSLNFEELKANVDGVISTENTELVRTFLEYMPNHDYRILWLAHAPHTLLRMISGIAILHIDGDHSYEGVMADFHVMKNNMRTGGLMMFHDYDEGSQGIPQANGAKIEVRRAVQEIQRLYPEYFKFFEELHPNGRGAGMFVGYVR